MTAYVLERAWIDGRVAHSVHVGIENGRFVSVEENSTKSGNPLSGLTLPGMANTHSHAFHRALRGRTQTERGTFWSWREQMYALADKLDPESYYELAKATFSEMVATGYTSVGEFHYLHHQPDGKTYDDPNAIGKAVLSAARDAGIRITLLDTLYLSSGFGAAPAGVQVRFADQTEKDWRNRVDGLMAMADSNSLVGFAAHSVRAIPKDAFVVFGEFVQAGVPLHIHLSEQVKENEGCQANYGMSPTALLAEVGFLGPMTSVVHATHLSDEDIRILGDQQVFAAICPTTERDLGDGIGPTRALHIAGVKITLGSDSHAVIDGFEEMRAVELNERLATQERGHWSAGELIAAATQNGQQSLGFFNAGEIKVGNRADLVTIDLNSPRTAGTGSDEQTAVFGAGSADVKHVVVDGREVFRGGHAAVGAALAQIIDRMHQ